jgi:hypothetical protein
VAEPGQPAEAPTAATPVEGQAAEPGAAASVPAAAAAANKEDEVPTKKHEPSGVQRFSSLFSLPSDITDIVIKQLNFASIEPDVAELDPTSIGASHFASLLPPHLRVVYIDLELDMMHDVTPASKQLFVAILGLDPNLQSLELTLCDPRDPAPAGHCVGSDEELAPAEAGCASQPRADRCRGISGNS